MNIISTKEVSVMKTIEAQSITQTVKDLCIQANYTLTKDITSALAIGKEKETWPVAQSVLGELLENIEIAETDHLPLCQDTGMAVVFLELGQDVHVVGGNLSDAVHNGVALGYQDGLLRKSVVSDPLERVNTGDNTPAVIHYNVVPGENLTITVAPKGFGSENMSRIAMIKPSDGVEGVKNFVLETVKLAGPNPCPPIVVGIGIGGTFEKVAALAKFALLRPVTESNCKPYYKDLEETLLTEINALGIGPQGFGGKTTCLGVNIETYPTHIAGLPVAVNINCHATRHATAVL